jgi:hypothetical protein
MIRYAFFWLPSLSFLSPTSNAFHVPLVIRSLRTSPSRSAGTLHRPVRRCKTALFSSTMNSEDDSNVFVVSRRGFVASAGSLTTFLVQHVPAAQADDNAANNDKVLVLGGTGFVGSQVVQKLRDLGVAVVATSRTGRDNTEEFDVTKGADYVNQRMKKLASECTAVISCIGSIGTPDDEAVNSGTGLAATAAKAAGVSRFVYITVAPEVKEFAKDIDFLKPYMDGKSFSRTNVLNTFGDQAFFIEPTFIYGGGSFELSPPRVAAFYGKFIEELLSSSPVRSVERLLSPGLIKIALEPPVPVEAVASAAVAGALGKAPTVLDTYDKIKEAAELV